MTNSCDAINGYNLYCYYSLVSRVVIVAVQLYRKSHNVTKTETKCMKHVQIFHLSENATNKQEKSYVDYSCAYNEKTLYCWFVAISNE